MEELQWCEGHGRCGACGAERTAQGGPRCVRGDLGTSGTESEYGNDQLKVFKSAFIMNLIDYKQLFAVFFFLMEYTTISEVIQTCPLGGL